MKKVHSFSGYTLIELLVVVAIISLFFFLALAAYQSFNKSQALITAAHEVKSALRDAQNRAMSGEKDCSTLELSGWKFTWVASGLTYSLQSCCPGGCGPVACVCSPATTLKTYKLPNVDGITFYNSGQVFFKPVNGLAEIPAVGSELCLKSNSNTSYKISVSTSGGISEEKFSASIDCTL